MVSTATEQKSITDLLDSFPHLFDGSLGTFKNIEPYQIPLQPDAKPIHTRPYTIPQIYQHTVRTEIERLLKLGIIEKDISSPWASPCFVIPKKNGQVRLVVDYRKLNQQLIRQPFPLPKIQEIFRTLQTPQVLI